MSALPPHTVRGLTIMAKPPRHYRVLAIISVFSFLLLISAAAYSGYFASKQYDNLKIEMTNKAENPSNDSADNKTTIRKLA